MNDGSHIRQPPGHHGWDRELFIDFGPPFRSDAIKATAAISLVRDRADYKSEMEHATLHFHPPTDEGREALG